MKEKNIKFSSLGFILAAVGSAVGLGNIWKFPYMAGQNGGGVFVIVYIACILFIGLSIFMCELIIGKYGSRSVVSSFEKLAPESSKKFWKIGGLSILSAFLVLSYYTVVISWIMSYILETLFGSLSSDINVASAQFDDLVNNSEAKLIILQAILFSTISFVLFAGVKKGIERINLILIPSLIGILLFLLFYSMTLSGFGQAIDFLFSFNVDQFSFHSFVQSIGHSFFTLSVGSAAIIAYATSMRKNDNIVKSSFYVMIIDTLVALVAGIGIFSILFTVGADPQSGPGLVFISVPTILHSFGNFGIFVGLLFFIALFFAGFSSAISLIEPLIEYLSEKGISRKFSVILANFSSFVLSIFIIYSMREGSTFNLFNALDFVVTNIAIPLMSLASAIFVGYYVDKKIGKDEVEKIIGKFGYQLWMFSIRFLAPVAIVIVVLNLLGVLNL